ncbi:Homoserine O-acetyltransferase [Beauveria bassiana]|uniref:Homoserine O-acetyltransferase n=1 Tax=Beauveria bassiana TaxID=176275 RepID=A0A2N6NFY0_BEABA|nr:Homoserine O-acetyltransferase [Beauveria bassiana]
MATSNDDYSTFNLGDFRLSSGVILPSAFIAYKTFGTRSNPAIIYPSWFSGSISDNEWLVGPGKALDPARYFIIIPALIGNGQSVSPSNTRERRAGVKFPDVTVKDNVTAQHRLVTEGLGVTHARAVLGWSMGAGQTYQWLTQYPDFMDLGVPFCGSARTSIHNQVFLEGVKSALLAAKRAASAGSARGEVGSYTLWTDEERVAGLKAFGRVYAGWGFSQQFYREQLYKTKLGFKDLEDFMVKFWEAWALSKGTLSDFAPARIRQMWCDPENMLHMLHTWQAADCSDQPPYNKDLEKAMAGIKAKTLVLPGKTDLYFPPEDSEYEVKYMSEGRGKCIPFPSIWGHWAGGPGSNPEDVKWLDDKLKDFLENESW